MFGKYCGIIIKTLFLICVLFLLFSCGSNEIDQLLNEADLYLNRNYFNNNISKNRFENVMDELDKRSNDMSLRQLEKYVQIMTKVVDLAKYSNIHFNFKNQSDSPYVGRIPEYSYFDGIGRITTRTRDFPIVYNVTVEMIIGYDLNDQNANNELINRKDELNDFVRRYFSGKTADELAPEKEEQMKAEIREMLNTRFFDTARARIILFNRLDVMEEF